jgi:hypothetical protein
MSTLAAPKDGSLPPGITSWSVIELQSVRLFTLPTSSGLANTDLDLILKRHGIERVIVSGLRANTASTRPSALPPSSATTSRSLPTRLRRSARRKSTRPSSSTPRPTHASYRPPSLCRRSILGRSADERDTPDRQPLHGVGPARVRDYSRTDRRTGDCRALARRRWDSSTRWLLERTRRGSTRASEID